MIPVCLDCKSPAENDVCERLGHAVVTIPKNVRPEWKRHLAEAFRAEAVTA